MLLQELKLNNIRTYIEETINFSKGSTLLSGDIGSGKSTILFSIEFALFGTSRPDLPAESLLRKGSTHGSVELKFRLRGQEIIIKRTLKKEKDSIKQLPGYIIINNTKKELMPVEMKAEIISLLGYPEELITKNKNHIFRYTIYTPQEEMKFILQENDEIRLNVLRKIFNLDKYKIIRENMEIFLKTARTDIAVLKTKLEPFDDEKNKSETIRLQKEKVWRDIENIQPLHLQLNQQLNKEKEETRSLENEYNIFLELKQQYNTYLALLKEKNSSIERLKEKETILKQEISQLKIDKDEEQTKEELKNLEEQKNNLLERKSVIKQKLSYIQDSIKNIHEETGTLSRQLLKIDNMDKIKHQLTLDISKREELERKKAELNNLLQRTTALIIKNKTLLTQSKELKTNISSLENCPTCLQSVSDSHKHKIISIEEDKSLKAEKILEELEQKNNQINEQDKKISLDLNDIAKKEMDLQKISLEVRQLENKKPELEKKKEQLTSLVKENNFFMQELEELNKQDAEEIQKKILQLREIINLFSKRQFLEKSLLELQTHIKNDQQQTSDLQHEISAAGKKIAEKEDLTLKIESKKKIFSELSLKEKEYSIQLATLRTQSDDLNRQLQESEKVLEKLNKQKTQLIRLKELYHWLQEYFLKLAYTIERQVMGSIHNHFNQVFQEWFTILIDDENVHSRIDDTFTPIILQNGYEIFFSNLSGGEKTSAALAYRLALNKVINDIIGGINTKDLLILDEPTDGFSTEQLDKVRDVLERLQLQQTIIVSHESKIESFVENIIRISKSGHESHVIV